VRRGAPRSKRQSQGQKAQMHIGEAGKSRLDKCSTTGPLKKTQTSSVGGGDSLIQGKQKVLKDGLLGQNVARASKEI